MNTPLADSTPNRRNDLLHAEPQDISGWAPTIQFKALGSRVLVVAKTRIEGAWAAYCDAVPGKNHRAEYQKVLKNGGKLPAELAKVLFPAFDHLPYAK